MKNKQAPAVILVNPKFAVNVGNSIRACAAYGVNTLVWTGDRVTMKGEKRLPREERMKGYNKVDFSRFNKPLNLFGDVTPVCIEIGPSTENLAVFDHPDNAVYVFGPEDGSVPQVYRRLCHRFVQIPTYHCVNLAQAVNVVLFHRRLQLWDRGILPLPELAEDRGFIE